MSTDLLTPDAWVHVLDCVGDLTSSVTLATAVCRDLRVLFGFVDPLSSIVVYRRVLNAWRRMIGMYPWSDADGAEPEEQRQRWCTMALNETRMGALVLRSVGDIESVAFADKDPSQSDLCHLLRFFLGAEGHEGKFERFDEIPLPPYDLQPTADTNAVADWLGATRHKPPLRRCVMLWATAASLGMDDACHRIWTAHVVMKRSAHAYPSHRLEKVLELAGSGIYDDLTDAVTLADMGAHLRYMWRKRDSAGMPWWSAAALRDSIARNLCALATSQADLFSPFVSCSGFDDAPEARMGFGALCLWQAMHGLWDVEASCPKLARLRDRVLVETRGMPTKFMPHFYPCIRWNLDLAMHTDLLGIVNGGDLYVRQLARPQGHFCGWKEKPDTVDRLRRHAISCGASRHGRRRDPAVVWPVVFSDQRLARFVSVYHDESDAHHDLSVIAGWMADAPTDEHTDARRRVADAIALFLQKRIDDINATV